MSKTKIEDIHYCDFSENCLNRVEDEGDFCNYHLEVCAEEGLPGPKRIYYVSIPEVCYRTLKVEASDEQEALDKAANDEYLEDCGSEYSHTMDLDYWNIEAE